MPYMATLDYAFVARSVNLGSHVGTRTITDAGITELRLPFNGEPVVQPLCIVGRTLWWLGAYGRRAWVQVSMYADDPRITDDMRFMDNGMTSVEVPDLPLDAEGNPTVNASDWHVDLLPAFRVPGLYQFEIDAFLDGDDPVTAKRQATLELTVVDDPTCDPADFVRVDSSHRT